MVCAAKRVDHRSVQRRTLKDSNIQQRIVGIAGMAGGIKSRHVRLVEPGVLREAPWEIRVGPERAAEGDRIRTPVAQRFRGTIEAIVRIENQYALECAAHGGNEL